MRIAKRLSVIGATGVLLTGLAGAAARADDDDPTAYGAYSCGVSVSYNIWSTGFVATITVTNTGKTTFSPWILQALTRATLSSAWNGGWSQTRPSIQATNPVWHDTIAPGESYSVGLTATYAAPTTNAHPLSHFTLNGVPCATVTAPPIGTPTPTPTATVGPVTPVPTTEGS
jgi:hypothetical protein